MALPATEVPEQKLIEIDLPEARDAAKIVNLVNEAIQKTRELARGLLPVVSDAQGLMSALQQWAGEKEFSSSTTIPLCG